MKTCVNCGTECEDTIEICPKCGARFTNEASPNRRYCTHYGAQVAVEAVVCVKCGCAVNGARNAGSIRISDKETIHTIIKIFCWLSVGGWGICALFSFGLGLIPLAWQIPMTISISRKLENNEYISTAFKVCTLLFVSIVSGILLLCFEDD